MTDMPFFIPHVWQGSERCFNLIVIEINNRFHRANCFSVWCMKCVWNSNIHTYISGSFRLVDGTLAVPVYFKATIGLHGDRNHTSHFENLFCCFIDQNFEDKKKIIWKRHPFGIKFHRVFVIALGIKFRKVYIFSFFIFEIWAGRCPPAAVHLQDALTSKKGTHPLLFFLPAMLIIIRKTIKKKWNLIPLRRAYEWPKESARTST